MPATSSIDPFDETTPTARDIRVFGLLWLLFFAALGGLTWWRPAALLGAATFLGSAWLVSLLFGGLERRTQWTGLALPALFAASGALGRWSGRPPIAPVVLGAIAVVGALAIWSRISAGRRIYLAWMRAAEPIGWTVTRVVLGLVYYGVLTPTGLAMRLAGRDPMQRRPDRSASSYWIARDRRADSQRYFRTY